VAKASSQFMDSLSLPLLEKLLPLEAKTQISRQNFALRRDMSAFL
jgi:hypothetical protein